MAGVAESSLLGDVRKLAVSKVVEEVVSMPYRRYKQIWLSIIIDIGKRCRCTDLSAQAHPSLFGDVFKLAAAYISPKFIAAKLIDEINIVEAVAVDIRYSDTVAVIIMISLVFLPGVVHD